ncbi:MAG: hypothetical protein P1Q69_05300 [Candidatus Thorarchaeota archaeon]|nr:hypothetical protein [Candidatus Thorarchaeota archaeon]
MARSKSRIAFSVFAFFFVMLFITGSATLVQAQSFGAGWIEDEKLHVFIEFNGRNILDATEADPILIPRDDPITIKLVMNVTNDVPLNVSGVITFYYQGYPVLPITISQEVDGQYVSWVQLYPDIGANTTESFPLSDILELDLAEGVSVDLISGIYEVSLDFNYYEMDPGDAGRSAELHNFGYTSFFLLPLDSPEQAIFTVVGAITTVSTVSAVGTMGFNFKSIYEAIQTAHKARSIQKKTGEIRSLPNLLVIGALPALFSMLSGMVKVKKKKGEVIDEPDSVSEYRLKQRLREAAPPAWRVDKCPKCKRDWDKKTNTCKKCKIDEEQGRLEYAEYLSSKTDRAIKVVGKKKSISIKNLSKKVKTNEYNAGVIAAAMVDTDVTEIQKIETPFKSFVMNIGGLIFLVLTWQQLLGGASSEFQTTLTIVGAGLSLAVIVALYLARKTQIQKLTDRVDAGGKMMPTEAEITEEGGQAATEEEVDEAIEEDNESILDEPEESIDAPTEVEGSDSEVASAGETDSDDEDLDEPDTADWDDEEDSASEE